MGSDRGSFDGSIPSRRQSLPGQGRIPSAWHSLAGQERVVAHLRRAIELDRVPHAYLFSGPPGAPLVDTALALAMALSCQARRGEGCGLPSAITSTASGAAATATSSAAATTSSAAATTSAAAATAATSPAAARISAAADHADADADADATTSDGDVAPCNACSKIAASIHPDVVTLVREGAAQIVPIESVRSQVIARLGLPPHEGDIRVFIVEEATSMAPPAANALLKTLEEPPARTLFILCTTAPEQLLPTIRSRCQRIRFAGGTGIAVDTDPVKAERVAALGAELASDRHDPTLPSRIAEVKGDAAAVLVAAARQLHARAQAAAAGADGDRARRAAQRAHAILSWHTAVTIHNANPALAIDALVAQLGQLPPSA